MDTEQRERVNRLIEDYAAYRVIVSKAGMPINSPFHKKYEDAEKALTEMLDSLTK